MLFWPEDQLTKWNKKLIVTSVKAIPKVNYIRINKNIKTCTFGINVSVAGRFCKYHILWVYINCKSSNPLILFK